MRQLKSLMVLFALLTLCHGQHLNEYKKKLHHHHHGLHHLHFLSYLTFLAVKLKIVFFLGTIFTVSLAAAKIMGIIKLTEYMKHKYHHQEEKIVYVNPHHEHHEFGGYPGTAEYLSTKTHLSDLPAGQLPLDYQSNDRYTGSGRSTTSTSFYEEFTGIPERLRQLNITDMVFKEMGIQADECRKKFVCKAGQDVVFSTVFNLISDDSYGKYQTNGHVKSAEDCDSLYPGCTTA